MNYMEEMVRRIEANNFASLLGMKITELREGYARGEMELKAEHVNSIGSIHGGCIYSLADTISSAAAASCGARTTTLSSDFHFLSPAMNCLKLIAEAKMIKNGKRILVCDVEISHEDGKLLAKGTFSFFNLESDVT